MIIELIILQVITFIVLILAMRVLFYRQLSASLARLKTLHEENLAREEELKQKTELLSKQKEEELAHAKQEADQIISNSHDKALKFAADIEAQAKEQADKILSRASEHAKQFERDLNTRIQEEATQISLKIFKSVFGQNDMVVLQHQLVAVFIDELEKLPDEKFTVREGLFKVMSAIALFPEEKARLTHVLSQKLKNQQVTIVETVTPEIISGLIIQAGSFVIDGSLKNKINKTLAYLNI